MSPRGINTILVQRIESALGVTLSQQTQLARGREGQTVAPPHKPVSVDPTASATQKYVFADEVARRTAQFKNQARVPGQPTPGAGVDRSQTGASPLASAYSRPVITPSTQTHLSPVGRVLYELFERLPQGAGPVVSNRPLFVDAVMALRQQAMARAMANAANAGLFEGGGSKAQSIAPTPAIPASSTLSGALALLLHQTILQSGLFYEAQLTRALRGETWRFDRLREQPQGKNGAQLPAPGVEAEDDEQSPARQTQALVRQQLDALANQTIQWQGQAWPNVPLTWLLRPSEAYDPDWPEQSEGEADESLDKAWSSIVTVTLPKLGTVDVKIWVRGMETRLVITSHQAVEPLEAGIDQLHQRLEQAGIEAAQLDVQQKRQEST